MGDGATSGAGWLPPVGDIVFTNTPTGYHNNRYLNFNIADDYTVTNNIVSGVTDGSSTANSGAVAQIGLNVLTLIGNNNYPGGTTVSSGTLQVGNGGTTGTIGTGTATANSVLLFNRSDAVTFGGGINGTGLVAQAGSGMLTLTGNIQMTSSVIVTNDDSSLTTNFFMGTLVSSNGTLVVSGGSQATLNGILNVAGGTFVPASLSTGGSLSVSSNLTINAGTILAPLNKSLNTTNIVVAGTIVRSGGTLVVTNVGSALATGDKFHIFNQPVSGLTVSGAGATWQNNLAVDGTITATAVPVTINTNPPVLQVSLSGNTLSLGWPTNRGWVLLTNSVGLTAPTQWFPYAGSSLLTNVNIPIDQTKPAVFYRMVNTNTP